MQGKFIWLAGVSSAALLLSGAAQAQTTVTTTTVTKHHRHHHHRVVKTRTRTRVTEVSAPMAAPPPPPADTQLEERVRRLEEQLDAQKEKDEAEHTRLTTLEQNFNDTNWSFDNASPDNQERRRPLYHGVPRSLPG